jgi:N-methylhydantoinase B
MYFDSIEVDEQRFPIIIEKLEIVSDSGGAGKWRGSPASEVRFRARHDPVSFAYSADGYLNPARGVAGGLTAKRCEVWKSKGKDEKVILPKMSQEILQPGEILGSECCGGGGFGNPFDRDPEKVRWDAREGFISLEKAREIYGVVLDITKEQYEVDYEETKKLRKSSKIKA